MIEDSPKSQLKISVRNLVAYTCRSGDLDLTSFGSSNPVDAIRAHQQIQKSRPDDYQSEVPVSIRVKIDDFILDVGGRIDGVLNTPESVLIEEIKTTTKDLSLTAQSHNELHWGQLKCYAFIYAQDQKLQTIETRLTYFHLETRKTEEVCMMFRIEELRTFFEGLIGRFLEWIEQVQSFIRIRDESVRSLKFPFDSRRSGQDMMMEAVETSIVENQQLLIQAATGIGKTMAIVFPAIKSIPQRQAAKVFYLTARTTGKSAAEDAFDLLKTKDLRLKTLTLTAKDKICFNPDALCNAKECQYAEGYYDRINDALTDAFSEDNFRRETIESLCLEYRICPFQFSLELMQWVDFIVCDYNYVFDPRVSLKRFFDEGPNEHVFLIDEAHNLIDRARSMFSSELQEKTIRDLKRLISKDLPSVSKSLGSLLRWMKEYKLKFDETKRPFAEKEQPSDLVALLVRFLRIAEKWLSQNQATDFRQSLVEFYFQVQGFLRIAERYDESYATCYALDWKDLGVKLFCLDPSKQLKKPLECAGASVFFSATLSPIDYFMESFGCDKKARSLVFPSPFPQEHLCVLVASNVSTLYKHREETKTRVTDAISSMVNQKEGNYLVYFPSYQYMNSIHDLFIGKSPLTHTIVQTPDMSEYERDIFLTQFNEENGKQTIGFAVLGGVFAESIDLLGDRLTGVVIVGVGLPGLCLERELIRDYYDRLNESGFAFAYQFPGMVKVMQAGGRVIRSEQDRGSVLLIGTRFRKPPYRTLLPEDWKPVVIGNLAMIEEMLQDFWNKKVTTP